MSQLHRYWITGAVLLTGSLLFVPSVREGFGDLLMAILMQIQSALVSVGLYF